MKAKTSSFPVPRSLLLYPGSGKVATTKPVVAKCVKTHCKKTICGVLRWSKEGRELLDGEKYRILNDARSGILSLTVIGATEADIGQYECEVNKTHTPRRVSSSSSSVSQVYFMQLWNEFGCVRCKAGLCPAYVPPTDVESDHPQDLPAKGRRSRPAEGKYPPNRLETLYKDVLSAAFEKRGSTCHRSPHLTSDQTSTSHQTTSLHNKLHQTASVPILNHYHSSIVSR